MSPHSSLVYHSPILPVCRLILLNSSTIRSFLLLPHYYCFFLLPHSSSSPTVPSFYNSLILNTPAFFFLPVSFSSPVSCSIIYTTPLLSLYYSIILSSCHSFFFPRLLLPEFFLPSHSSSLVYYSLNSSFCRPILLPTSTTVLPDSYLFMILPSCLPQHFSCFIVYSLIRITPSDFLAVVGIKATKTSLYFKSDDFG